MVEKMRNRAVVLAALSAIAGAQGMSMGATMTWDAGGADTNWSTGNNWTGTPDNTPPSAAADIAAFAATGTAAVGTVTNTVDTNTSIFALRFTQTGPAVAHTTQINPGVTLSLANSDPAFASNTSSNIDNASLFIVPATVTSPPTVANVVFTGQGALNVTDGNIVVSGRTNAGSTSYSGATLDLSGLASFTFNRSASAGTGILRVGGGETGLSGDGQYFGKMTLGPSSNIAINRITIGGDNGGSGPAQPVSTLQMGTLNNINNGWAGSTAVAGGIFVGADPRFSKVGSGAITNAVGLTDTNAPVTNIGTSAARNQIQIGAGHAENGTGHSSFGVVDFTSASGMNANASLRVSDGEINAYFSTLTIGKAPVKTETFGSSISPTGAGVGMFSFDKGTVDATSIILGSSSSTNNKLPNVGHLNVGLRGNVNDDAGAGSLIAGSITIGDQTNATTDANNTNFGVLNVGNSGSVTADKIFVGNSTSISGASRSVGVLNIGSSTTGGTVTTNQVRAGGASAQQGTPTRIVNFNGGTLQVKAGTTGTDATQFLEGMTAANVYAGGGTIDTTGGSVVIGQSLVAPASQGISGITFTGGTGYRVAPVVHISGGGGVGATAVAKINSDGTLNSIYITNPGTGYGQSQPTIYLVANGSTGDGTIGSGSSGWSNMTNPYGGAKPTALTATFADNVSGGITKIGDNVLTLTGVNTYTGATDVKGGTLLVNGDGTTTGVLAAASAVTVFDGATVGGTGKIGGSITVNDGGTISPGASVESLSVGSLSLSAGSSSLFEIQGDGQSGNFDTLTASGNVNFAGTLKLDFAANYGDGTWQLFGFATSAGNFTSIVDRNGFYQSDQLSFNPQTGVLTAAVPEPASIGLLAMAGGLLVGRRRRAVR